MTAETTNVGETTRLIREAPLTQTISCESIYNGVNENFLNLILASGIIQGVTSTYMMTLKCNDPEDEACLLLAQRISQSLTMIVYFKIVSQAIRLGFEYENIGAKALTQINKFLDQAIQFVGTHNFCLLTANAIAAEAAGSPYIPDRIFWSAVFLPATALTLAIGTPEYRESIRQGYLRKEEFPANTERGPWMKAVDVLAGAGEGFISMATFISLVAGLHDVLSDKDVSWVNDKNALIGRYILSGAWAIVYGGLNYKYSPVNLPDEVITFKDDWKRYSAQILPGVFRVIVMLLFNIFSLLTQNDKSFRNTMLCLYGGMVIMGLVQSLLGVILNNRAPQNSHEDIQQHDESVHFDRHTPPGEEVNPSIPHIPEAEVLPENPSINNSTEEDAESSNTTSGTETSDEPKDTARFFGNSIHTIFNPQKHKPNLVILNSQLGLELSPGV